MGSAPPKDRGLPPLHVAFFNRAFHPEESATALLLRELAEGLVQDYGCRVSVVAGFPVGGSQRSCTAGLGLRLICKEQLGGITIFRARGTTLSKSRFAGRAANYLSYFGSACLAGLRLDKPGVIVALTDPPIIGLAALLAARRFRCPLVISYRDLFPEVGHLLEDFRSPLVDWILTQVNRTLISQADRLIALGEDMKERLCGEKGARPDRVVVIPDWADGKVFVPVPKQNPFSAEHGLADRFVVMHAGNLGVSQNLEQVLEAAHRLEDLHDLVWVFMGDGVKRPLLQEQARRQRLENVRFLPFQPKERVSLAFGSADCFVISLKPGLAGYITPSKLYGILACGRPYVASVDKNSDVARITQQHQCGLLSNAGDPQDLAEKIRLLYEDRQRVRQMGACARKAAALYDRRVGVKAYYTLCLELTQRRHPDDR